MSSAASREARRKAILSRGSDRLNKLTTSARGADAPGIIQDDSPPRATRLNVDDTPIAPPPPEYSSCSPSPPLGRPSAPPLDPSVWSEEQRRRFIEALMGSDAAAGFPSPQSPPPLSPPAGSDAPSLASADPFATLMGSTSSLFDPAASSTAVSSPSLLPHSRLAASKESATAPPTSAPTRTQRWIPLVHLVSVWCLLGWFVLWQEPRAFAERRATIVLGGSGGDEAFGWSRRWSELRRASSSVADVGAWGVQVVPFFWVFTALQLALHSLRITSGLADVEPGMVLSFVLEHVPPPLPSLLVNGLRYLRMGSLFLDDLACVIVGIGFVVLAAQWRATS